ERMRYPVVWSPARCRRIHRDRQGHPGMMPGLASADAGVLQATSGGGGGGGSVLDTQTVYVSASGSKLNGTGKYGYIISSLGNLSDGTSNIYSGAVIRQLLAQYEAGDLDVIFTVTGIVSNS